MRHVHADEGECERATASTVGIDANHVNAETATRTATADDSVKRYANTEWKTAVASFAPRNGAPSDAVPVACPPHVTLPGSHDTAVAAAAATTAANSSEPAVAGPGLGDPTAAERVDTDTLARRTADVVCTGASVEQRACARRVA